MVVLLASIPLVGCGSVQPRLADTKLAESLHESVIRGAIGYEGAIACRQLQVGIAERDWVRGRVSEVDNKAIGVRVQDPGRFPKVVKEMPVVPGAVLRAAPGSWTPCV